MTEQQNETKTLAETALADALGGPVRLGDGANLSGREHVFRFEILDGPSGAPSSMIVKRARDWGSKYDLESTDPWNPAWGLLDDWASLQFLNEVTGDVGLAPHFIAGDKQNGLIAIEDLGSGDRPDELLLGTDATVAESAMVELAAMLGLLHARTVGKQANFDRIRDSLGRRIPADHDPVVDLRPAVYATIEVLGLSAPAGLDHELRVLTTALQQPGPFSAYTHGDPCPDNWLQVDGRLRLLDFERAKYRHALLDGVYGRIHFPTCWCVNRSPEYLPPRMEAAYRAELLKGCPEAADDTLFGQAVVNACAFWVIDMCQWIVQRRVWYEPPALMEHDRQWGISTIRQRALVRADILAQTTQEFGYLETIGSVFAALAIRLRKIWPVDADAMPLYPAFRGHQA